MDFIDCGYWVLTMVQKLLCGLSVNHKFAHKDDETKEGQKHLEF